MSSGITLFRSVIHANVNVLTREIQFVTFSHGKPPLGMFLFGTNKIYHARLRLAFYFFIIRSQF